MEEEALDDLVAHVARLEDKSDDPAVDHVVRPGRGHEAGAFAGDLWLEDGVYDWVANGDPHEGGAGWTRCCAPTVISVWCAGRAHFAGPLLIEVDGDTATAVNYSLIMRREEDRHYLWRVSAVRWDVERSGASWRVRKRSNRLLDASGAGSRLFGETLQGAVRDTTELTVNRRARAPWPRCGGGTWATPRP